MDQWYNGTKIASVESETTPTNRFSIDNDIVNVRTTKVNVGAILCPPDPFPCLFKMNRRR